eukprot:jgi/Chrzof1/797/Cz01g29060.t1
MVEMQPCKQWKSRRSNPSTASRNSFTLVRLCKRPVVLADCRPLPARLQCGMHLLGHVPCSRYGAAAVRRYARSRSGVVATVGSAPMATWISASLPTYAAEFMDPFMDQQAADVPYMFEVLFFAVVMYTTVMMLYLWMTNFLEQADSDDDQPMDDVPPAYKHYLQAPIRSVTDPAQRAANEEAALCAGDVEVLKRKLAAGAAAYVDQRIRNTRFLVRLKLQMHRLRHQMHVDEDVTKISSSTTHGLAASEDHFIDDCLNALVCVCLTLMCWSLLT